MWPSREREPGRRTQAMSWDRTPTAWPEIPSHILRLPEERSRRWTRFPNDGLPESADRLRPYLVPSLFQSVGKLLHPEGFELVRIGSAQTDSGDGQSPRGPDGYDEDRAAPRLPGRLGQEDEASIPVLSWIEAELLQKKNEGPFHHHILFHPKESSQEIAHPLCSLACPGWGTIFLDQEEGSPLRVRSRRGKGQIQN